MPLVQGGVLVIALSFVLVNLAVDTLYAWLDPRIKFNKDAKPPYEGRRSRRP